MKSSLTLLSLLSGAVAAFPADTPDHDSRYDFIVVGGGTSGLVIADRLSEDPTIKVAIIEAGGSVLNNSNVYGIDSYGKALGTEIDWAYQSVPQTYAGGKPATLSAAKALGGTSTINGMAYLRAETSQIDAWERLGNKGWNWDALLPYYKKSEYLQTPTEAQADAGAVVDPTVHGYDGPLTVGWPYGIMNGSIVEDLNSTYQAVGLPYNPEANGGNMRGFNVFPKTLNRELNVREDAARAYYYPVAKRPNLDIYLNAFAERMIWDSGNRTAKPFARGVIFTNSKGSKQTILANKEVIVSAGSLRSPLILELSGVGNPTILNKHGIDVKVNNPFVGENLQDQTNAGLSYGSNTNFSGAGGFVGYFSARDIYGNQTASINATVAKSLHAYAETIANLTGGVIDVNITTNMFKLQHELIFKNEISIAEILLEPSATGTIAVEYWGLLPFSRGNIHITSSNASAAASINPNYFLIDYDVQQAVGASRMGRKLANTAPLSGFVTEEVKPGLSTQTDAEWAAWLKDNYRSNYHYISTAAMMAQELGGVVDSDLLVYGTDNVRVVDASVLPMQVCGHLTATLYAVAEKAADAIKARYA